MRLRENIKLLLFLIDTFLFPSKEFCVTSKVSFFLFMLGCITKS